MNKIKDGLETVWDTNFLYIFRENEMKLPCLDGPSI